ncbi:unnamed protein product [Hyaloperonospora brassicae]|uniref:RxLR effector candidate protein n=1 Tax=Hyaloperonospora brassicae TaxID=162125 RepID=A0AAV0UTA1_HYABA|nr:unnamed protein product [Hyaloperonospora brassicae]
MWSLASERTDPVQYSCLNSRVGSSCFKMASASMTSSCHPGFKSEFVQTEILLLPASSTNAFKRRKTIDVNRRLFTREDLQNMNV